MSRVLSQLYHSKEAELSGKLLGLATLRCDKARGSGSGFSKLSSS